MDRKYALIPAYEPDGRLLEIIEDAVAEGFQVIVVDDGSSDGCQRYFKQAEYMATVLHHSENKGKGAALKTGFAWIASMCEADDVVVTLDADGQHTIQDALKVCAEACIHPDSLILGSRALADNVPLRSRFGNTVTRFVYRLASGVKVHGALDIYGTTNRLTIIYLIVGLVLILAGTIQYAIDCRRYRCA